MTRGTLRRRVLPAIAGAAAVLWPAAAEAHLVTTGLGPIYDGISHVLLSPDDLVPVLAMALVAGLNGSIAGRRALFALTAAWLAGGMAGFASGGTALPAGLTAGSFLVLGGLAAADVRLPSNGVAALAIVLGLLHGFLNGAGLAGAGRDPVALTGIAGAVFVVAALAAALVVSRGDRWRRLAFRVAGSWVAAIGLLMLGWTLRGAA